MIYLHSSPFILHPLILLFAFLTDFTIGDPRWLPHPVRIIGTAISRTETILRKFFTTPAQEKFAGLLLVVLITTPVFLITFILCREAGEFRNTAAEIIGIAAIVILTSTTIALHGLVSSARLVMESLAAKDIEEARIRLSMIVGRDTHMLSEKDILRATMETLAENLSDGVVAPVFYLAVGGLPLAMTYKAINTLDSMVGYKNSTYLHFGWAAARLDDMANYLPARITGILIVTAVFLLTSLKKSRDFACSARRALAVMLRDGAKHTSPNSGIPEAAMAGALGIRMGGPSTYGGIMVEKPYIGEACRESNAKDYLVASENAIIIVKAAALLSMGLAAIISFLRGTV